MLKRIISGAVASTLSAALLAGCGGGGGSLAVPSTPGNGGGKTTSVALKITMPGRSVQTKSGKRIPLYTSRSTVGIGISFAPTPSVLGTAPIASPNYAQKIAVNDANAPGCPATANTDGSYTCTIYIPGVQPGYNDFSVTLWDTAPAGCSVGGFGGGCNFTGDHALSTNVLQDTDVTLAGTTTNLPSFTLDPVVDSAYVQLNSGIVDGTISTVNGQLVLKDAAGNIITGGDNLVDASGNALTITLSVSQDLGAVGCNDNTTATSCSLYFNTAADPAFTTSAANTFTLNYDGAVAFATSGATQPAVTITPSSAIGGLHNNAALTVTQTNGSIGVPGVPQVTVLDTTFTDASAAQNTLTLGSDGALWTVRTPSGSLERSTPGGAFNNVGSGEGLIGTPGAVAAGSEGYIWYTDTTNNKIGRFAPGLPPVTVTESTAIAGATLTGLAQGPGGNIWFGDAAAGAGHDSLDNIDPNVFTTPTVYSLPDSPNTPSAVAVGPLFAGSVTSVCTISVGGTDHVDCLKKDTTWTSVIPTATPISIVTGPDNKLYVGEVGQIEVFKDNGSGTLIADTPASYALSAPGTPQVESMAVGHDGNIWFTENGATSPTFGALTIQSSVVKAVEYSANTGIAGTTTPLQIVLGPSPNYDLFYSANGPDGLEYITP